MIPVASRRCVVKLDAKREGNKRKRWQAVAESAAKQSGRALIPQVGPVAGFADALTQAQELDLCLIPYECAGELLGDARRSAMECTRELLEVYKKGSPSVSLLDRRAVLKKKRWKLPWEWGRSLFRWENGF